MSQYLPFTEQHSIQEVQVALHFQREFAEEEIVSARAGFEPTIKDALPRRAELRGGSVTVDMSAEGAQVRPGRIGSGLVGFQYSRIKGDGKPSRILELANNVVSVRILEYEGWDTVRKDIIDYTKALLAFLDLEANPVMAASLNFTDRYTFDGDSTEAKAELLFVKENEYITTRSFTAGPLWHCHSGWFEQLGTAGRILNRLNIRSNLIDLAPTVTIEHQATVQFATPRQSFETVFGLSEESGGIAGILDSLHDKNKEILTALIQPEMLAKIGMSE